MSRFGVKHAVWAVSSILVMCFIALWNNDKQLALLFPSFRKTSKYAVKLRRSVRRLERLDPLVVQRIDPHTTLVKVPKIVHFMIDNDVPAHQMKVMEYSMDVLKSFDFEVMVHRESDIEKLIDGEYPSLMPAWEMLSNASEETDRFLRLSDFGRIVVMYHYGGVYLDGDMVPCGDLKELVNEPGLASFPLINTEIGHIANSVMSGPPKHEVWGITLERFRAKKNLATGELYMTTGRGQLAHSVTSIITKSRTLPAVNIMENQEIPEPPSGSIWVRSGLIRLGAVARDGQAHSRGKGTLGRIGIIHLSWVTYESNQVVATKYSRCDTMIHIIEKFLVRSCLNVEHQDNILWSECGSGQANTKPFTPTHVYTEKFEDKSLPYVNGIKAPSDMWRYPSQHKGWDPLPLPNCCANGHPNEKEQLRYYGPGSGYTPHDFKAIVEEMKTDIILIGDSISAQWRRQLSCYLGAETHDDPNVKEEITESFYRHRPDKQNEVVADWTGFYIPTDEEGAPMRKLVLRPEKRDYPLTHTLAFLEYCLDQYQHDFPGSKPIIVINIGLHYNHWEGEVQELRQDIKRLAQLCVDKDGHCVFRETSPQYFETKVGNGLFRQIGGKCIKKPVEAFGKLNEWRNKSMYRALYEVTKNSPSSKNGGFLKVMPLFDKLVALDGHYTKNQKDCTHLGCLSNIWEPWHVSLMEVLYSIAGEETAKA